MVDFKQLVDHVRLSPPKAQKAAVKKPEAARAPMRPDALQTTGPAPSAAITSAMQGVNGRLKDLAAATMALSAEREKAPSTQDAIKVGLRMADLQRAATQLGGLRDTVAALAVRRPPLSEKDASAVAKLAFEAGHERDPARLSAIATSIRKHANATPVDAQLFNATRALDWQHGHLTQQATMLVAEGQDAPDAQALQRVQLQLDDVLKQRALVAEAQGLVSSLAFGVAPRGERKDAIFQLAHQAAEAQDLVSLNAITEQLREAAAAPR
jgi:hypothetical protein